MKILVMKDHISDEVMSNHDIILLFDNEYCYSDIWAKNPKNLATSYSELLGVKIKDSFVGEQGEQLEGYVKNIFDTQNECPLDYEMETLGGQKWFSGVGKPITIQDKPYVLFTAKDVTHLKNARLSNAFPNNQFDEVAKAGIEKERIKSIGELAAGLGHEINNPLTILFGYLHQLENSTTDQLQKKLLDKCLNAATRIQETVKNVKELYPDPNIQKRKIDIKKHISDSYSLLSQYYSKEDIELKIELPNEDVFTLGNKSKFQQCLFHVLANAKKAVSENTETKEILIKIESDEKFVHVKVIDNGHGISKENAPKIFDAFFTTHVHRDHQGMGLSITHNLLATMDSTISFIPNLDRGVTFKMSFPKFVEEND